MDTLFVLGAIGTATGLARPLPQFVRLLRIKAAHGVSGHRDLPIFVNNFFQLTTSLMILARRQLWKRRFRAESRSSEEVTVGPGRT